MRNFRFNISLYVIIPLISIGAVALAVIITYEITAYYLRKGQPPFWPMAFWSMVMLVFAGGISFLIARIIIDPLERFVQKAENLGVVQKNTGIKESIKDDMGRFTHVFDQVTELLSGVEARKLFPLISGSSRGIRGVLNLIIKVAPTDSTVLVLGETGTGKELVARSIYKHSRRKDKPFVTINCAAIPAGLLESELFGHEKGAFTDAGARKTGRFELADKGTIFLDEIGDMPLDTQAKLLRVLENRYIERVGGSKQIKVDVRIIAATNRNLEEAVKKDRFRRDLFYRLNVFSIVIPPLRKRKEDIPAIADHFIKKLGKGVDIAPESMNILSAYHWPGNVRELQNIIESASITAKDTIEPAQLLSLIAKDPQEAGSIVVGDESDNSGRNIDQRIQEYEKGIIIAALNRAGGVQIRAAKMLGIKERSLWHRIKKYGIDANSFKVNAG
jgi:transcriptional regulator with GAF, ATPase, and Fis domain